MTQLNLTPDDLRRLAVLIEKVQACDPVCVVTGKKLERQEMLVNIALGFENEPHDLHELAIALDVDAAGLQQQIRMYIASRPCYRAAWKWAENDSDSDSDKDKEGTTAATLNLDDQKPQDTQRETGVEKNDVVDVNHESQSVSSPQHDPVVGPLASAHWDAGEMGCGELVLKLRKKLVELKPCDIIQVTALDSGAPEDIPAWCRMTRHTLIKMEHPEYWIKKRDSA